jgi:hypothetical protein
MAARSNLGPATWTAGLPVLHRHVHPLPPHYSFRLRLHVRFALVFSRLLRHECLRVVPLARGNGSTEQQRAKISPDGEGLRDLS